MLVCVQHDALDVIHVVDFGTLEMVGSGQSKRPQMGTPRFASVAMHFNERECAVRLPMDERMLVWNACY